MRKGRRVAAQLAAIAALEHWAGETERGAAATL
jgi:hypothetical protein